MTGYYAEKLAGLRLQRCYEVASPRIQQYLEAELLFALENVRESDAVLELGCGYGRIAARLAERARFVVGIDTASESLEMARSVLDPGCGWVCGDAIRLPFRGACFDVVVCAQNGICAFNVDQEQLLLEALRVTRAGGSVILSTYSDHIWPERLEWFEAQAAAGLLGPVDRNASGNGTIICEDGFRAGRLTPGGFRSLCDGVGVRGLITEVDGSSLFCQIAKE